MVFPFSNKFHASKEKVEKVVNPPQTPVFQNKVHVSGHAFSVLIPTIQPIRKAPRRFVINVSQGKLVFTGSKLIEYLPIAPRAPPSPTYRQFNISFVLLRPSVLLD